MKLRDTLFMLLGSILGFLLAIGIMSFGIAHFLNDNQSSVTIDGDWFVQLLKESTYYKAYNYRQSDYCQIQNLTISECLDYTMKEKRR